MSSKVTASAAAAKLGSAGSGHGLVGAALMICCYLVSSSFMAVLNNHAKKHATGAFSLLCLQNSATVIFITLAGLLGLAKVEKLRRAMTEKDRERFCGEVDVRCKAAYAAKAEWFMQIVNAKGNAGRNQMYIWCSHWLVSFLKPLTNRSLKCQN